LHTLLSRTSLRHTFVAHADPSPSLFSFLHFPSNLYLSFAAYWKKLTCGVIPSFNFCFSCSACLLLCFTCLSFLLLCFTCFSAFVIYLFLFFFASLLSLLLCFSAFASAPFYFYCSTFSFLRSCVFAALLPAPLLLCFLSLLPLSFFLLYFLLFVSTLGYFLLFVSTLGETQRNLKQILIKTPDKKPYMKT